MKNLNSAEDAPIRDEYDFSSARKNPYAERANRKTNLVVIEPDLSEIFATSEQVNEALRSLVNASKVPGVPEAADLPSQEHAKAS